MAKLHSYYVLCPLIDQKSFLGVSSDKDAENVIVTLGRNVVNKHRLSDQKQIGGWTSKDHITSAVIFDHELDSYVGVFNNNTIKTWANDTENLEKVKKYKFSVNILKLLPRKDQPSLVVFTNGNCTSLSYGLENRKTFEGKAIIKNLENIVEAAYYSVDNTDHICFITQNNKDKYEIVFCPLRNELGDLEKAKLNRVKVERPEHDVYVVGKLISADDHPVVYILWSDSKMMVYHLVKNTWKTIGNVPWISTLTSLSLAWMGDKHLILFGSNTNQEGGIIVAYNTSLGVGSCRYPMKMYSEGAKLYCFNGRIILESSNHIGMLPYVVETSRSLSSLLGSHEVILDDRIEIADWGKEKKQSYNFTDDVKSLVELGLTERAICSQVIPNLIDSKNNKKISKIIAQIKDIPESILVSLLSYIIKSAKAGEVDVTDKTGFHVFCTKAETQLSLLNNLFEIPFSDALLIPHLRNGLTLNDAMFLMTYISYLLVDSEKTFGPEYENKLIDWCTLIMDAFYQQYLMTKDEKLTHVLENMRSIVVDLLDQIAVIDNTLPMLNKLLTGKNIEEVEETLPYAIELMQI
ncbi:unnamed protein product [Plutella xylostella]|uniref:(diamondback moth) hypothetical protein n=1 Tax=Plutella xylostella TaxID=51655 RepID=A0A8S4D3J2_PLUXY|nr:unnamed protein product [Plutella xylostella]